MTTTAAARRDEGGDERRRFLISPAEPPELKRAFAGDGVISTLPETFGLDVMWLHEEAGLWCGMQRKTVADLLASMADDRLAKELAQMPSAIMPGIIIEGHVKWSTDGQMLGRYGQAMTLRQWNGVLWSLQERGVTVTLTSDLAGTVDAIRWYEQWTSKQRHDALVSRSSAKSSWGSPRDKDYGVWLLQGLPGVGRVLAERVWDYFGGLPWEWVVSKEELMQVQGVGAVMAERMMKQLGTTKQQELPPPQG